MDLICSRCGTESTHVLNLGHYQYVCARCKALVQADVARESIDSADLTIAPCTCGKRHVDAVSFSSHSAESSMRPG